MASGKWKLILQMITTARCAGLYNMEKLKLDPNQELTFPHVVALALLRCDAQTLCHRV